jgi:hypothetical protein
MQAALRARLLAAAPVTSLVAQRIYWVSRPQTTTLPAITLQTISDERPQHLKGFQALRPSRIQVDVWTDTYAMGRTITEAVIAALVPENSANSIRFDRALVDGVRDLGEQTDTKFIHRTSIDLIVWWATEE